MGGEIAHRYLMDQRPSLCINMCDTFLVTRPLPCLGNQSDSSEFQGFEEVPAGEIFLAL